MSEAINSPSAPNWASPINQVHGHTKFAELFGITTDNNHFLNGSNREQDPLYTIQGHLIYTFKPGLWLSGSLGYGYGGENTISGDFKDDRSKNLAFAVAGGYSISRNMGFKLLYVGIRTQNDTGYDSDSIAVSFSVVW